MEKQKINQLINKYLNGDASREEEEQLRKHFQKENDAEELQSCAELFHYTAALRKKMPANSIDPFAKINFEKKKTDNQPVSNNVRLRSLSRWSLRIAAGLALLIIGYSAGQWGGGDKYASTRQVSQLEQEVQQMKAALVNTGNYPPASAGERLSAVNISEQLPADDGQLEQQITDILTYTMNNDNSVNVRLAAAEALYKFRKDRRLKRVLIGSLAKQNDPRMQIALIDMLVELKAKGSINEMKKMLVDADTQSIVKERLKTSIARLQA